MSGTGVLILILIYIFYAKISESIEVSSGKYAIEAQPVLAFKVNLNPFTKILIK